jgi:AraC-like DNA-binding protein
MDLSEPATTIRQSPMRCYDTTSLLQACEYFRQNAAGFELRSTRNVGAFHFNHKRVTLGAVCVDFVLIDCGSDFFVDQVRDLETYSFKVPFDGICEFRIGPDKHFAGAGQVYAGNPLEPIRKKFVGLLSQAMVTVNRNALSGFLEHELGRPLTDPLNFASEPYSSADTRLFINLVEFLRVTMEDSAAAQHWRMAPILERTFMMAMLRAIPNNYSSELEKQRQGVAPFYVRKAEAFIRANLGAAITVEAIVEASGVSSRSLFYGFRRWRGTTPLSFVKGVRLDKARDELLRIARSGGSVTDVAVQVGYNYMSRFSSDYKARFGEKPSETLRCHATGPLH